MCAFCIGENYGAGEDYPESEEAAREVKSLDGIDRTKEIEDLIEVYHKGKGNAIKREHLLPELQSYIPDLEDRDMRKAYETLVLCWGNTGIYAPGTEKEKTEQIEKNKKLIRAYAREIKRIKNYRIKESQMSLFEEARE